MDLDTLLGIDPRDPLDELAEHLVREDQRLMDYLVAERKRQQLTQAQVAERMGISQGAVARIESGERDPHLSTLRRYAHAVRVRVIHMMAPADEARGVSRLLPGTWLGVEEWNRLPQTVGSR